MQTLPRETIPVLDLGPCLAGQPGADHFYFISHHGADQSLIDATFESDARLLNYRHQKDAAA